MNRFRPRAGVALAAGLALVLAACAGGTGASPTEADEPTPSPQASAEHSEHPSTPPASPDEEATPTEGASPSGEEAETVRVRLEGFAFDTEELTISAGTRVSFLNADSAAHTVTEGVDGQAAESPIIDEQLAGNQSASHVFDEPGTYQITCLFHPSMNMTIVVEG